MIHAFPKVSTDPSIQTERKSVICTKKVFFYCFQHPLICFFLGSAGKCCTLPAWNNHLCQRALEGSTWPRSDPYGPGAGSAFHEWGPAPAGTPFFCLWPACSSDLKVSIKIEKQEKLQNRYSKKEVGKRTNMDMSLRAQKAQIIHIGSRGRFFQHGWTEALDPCGHHCKKEIDLEDPTASMDQLYFCSTQREAKVNPWAV